MFNLPIICHKSYQKRVIELGSFYYQSSENNCLFFFFCETLGFKYFHWTTSDESWRSEFLSIGKLCWPLLWAQADQKLTEFDSFEIFHADAKDETKICLDKIWHLILSGQFLFIFPLFQRGPSSYGSANAISSEMILKATHFGLDRLMPDRITSNDVRRSNKNTSSPAPCIADHLQGHWKGQLMEISFWCFSR